MRIPIDKPYTITTQFGVPDSNAKFGRHSGVDYAGFRAGRAIYAPTNGMLMNIDSPTGGNMVVIFDGKYYHRLMHNSSFSREPGYVKEGNEVARAGTTGLSTGVHCHWDINTQGIYPTSFSAFVDPNSILNQGGQDMATNQQIDQWISLFHQEAYGGPASVATFNDWRKVLKNNFVDGSLSIMIGTDTNAGALKNQPKGEFEPYSGKPLYTKKG